MPRRTDGSAPIPQSRLIAEREALLARVLPLWQSGMSVSDIARELGMRKNQLSGLTGRALTAKLPGWEARGSPIKREYTRKPPKPRVIGRAPTLPVLRAIPEAAATFDAIMGRAFASTYDKVPKVAYAPRAPLPPPKDGATCQFPKWGTGRPTHIYCDNPRDRLDSPYCAECRRRCWVTREAVQQGVRA